MKNHSARARDSRRKGIIIAILAVLITLLIPVCFLLARDMLRAAPPPDEPVAASSSGVPKPVSSAEPEPEPEPSSEPEPEPEPESGPVPESEAVELAYFDDAVFFGDSITEGLGLYGDMRDATFIAATGVNPISAQEKALITLPDSDKRVSMLDALSGAPDVGKIYLELGANWVGEQSGISEETFLKHYRELLGRIRSIHPESVIYIQSMFPVSREYDTNENGKNRYGLTNALITEFNEALEQLARNEGVWYLDVNSALRDEEGYLPSDKTSDGMHLTPDYYQVWIDYLRTHTVPAPERGEEGESSAPTPDGDSPSGERSAVSGGESDSPEASLAGNSQQEAAQAERLTPEFLSEEQNNG